MVSAETVGFSSSRLGRIGSVMQRYIDEGKLAGTVTLVARRGQIVHFEAHGRQEIDSGKRMDGTGRGVRS